MKKYLPVSLLTAAVLTTSACSPLPPAVHVEQQNQVKLQSAQHWGTIANHIAGRLNKKVGKQPVYIDESQFNTKFSKVFSKQLVSELANSDTRVLVSPRVNSMELDITIDVVRHPLDRDLNKLPLTPVLANIWLISEFGVAGAIPSVIALDQANLSPSQTNTEVAVTTRLMSGAEVRFSETNVYYVSDDSGSLFEEIFLAQYSKKVGDVGLTDKEIPETN